MQLLYYYFSSIRTLWVRRWMQQYIYNIMKPSWLRCIWHNQLLSDYYCYSSIGCCLRTNLLDCMNSRCCCLLVSFLGRYINRISLISWLWVVEDACAYSLYIRSRDHFFSYCVWFCICICIYGSLLYIVAVHRTIRSLNDSRIALYLCESGIIIQIQHTLPWALLCAWYDYSNSELLQCIE